ncbi:hypothetical protein AMTR_s00135p00053470 [Amborella trichopoda]|uniref:Uncharacterized protein n=1 Tax=Amborella trichopoda TaxID=13333 RepID=W1P7F2_AMBTC|nr:hypothetical protein AMTR_s00135p00053470 [Amborella trichopoda]
MYPTPRRLLSLSPLSLSPAPPTGRSSEATPSSLPDPTPHGGLDLPLFLANTPVPFPISPRLMPPTLPFLPSISNPPFSDWPLPPGPSLHSSSASEVPPSSLQLPSIHFPLLNIGPSQPALPGGLLLRSFSLSFAFGG